MHEGDHSIVDEDHDHAVTPDRRDRAIRLIAGVVVGAGVVFFLVWQFMPR